MDLDNITKSDHQKCYFYCYDCGYEEILDYRPKNSITNMRGGYGRPLYQSACPKCHSLYAGCMYFDGDELDGIEKTISKT